MDSASTASGCLHRGFELNPAGIRYLSLFLKLPDPGRQTTCEWQNTPDFHDLGIVRMLSWDLPQVLHAGLKLR